MRQMYRILSSLILTLTVVLGAEAQTLKDYFKEADAFLSQQVVNGRVRYDGIKKSPETLNKLYTMQGNIDLSGASKDEQLAFYINAYNIGVIKTVVDHYPTNSPMSILGFFESKKHKITGKQMTLDHLENKIVRPQFKDPRIHFVLVCGALGCPAITNFAYVPEKLQSQLDTQAKKALNNDNFIRYNPDNKSAALSEIFKWYQVDFGKNQKEVIAYINKYRENAIADNVKVLYYDYDWTLNDGSGSATSTTHNSNVVGLPDGKEPDPIVDQPPTTETTNLQTFNAGSLLKKGQFDFTLFNSIYTETENNWQGTVYNGYRTTFASSLLQVTYGISKNARFNVGLDINMKASSRNSNPDFSNVTSFFEFKNNDSLRAGLGYVAPRIKWSPFKGNNDFSIQSQYFLSPAKSPEGDADLYWIEWNRHVWWNQIFYSKLFAQDKLQLFTELDLLFRFKAASNQVSMLDLPMSVFFSYFPTKNTTIYVMTQHVPRFVSNPGLPEINDWPIGANFTQSGIGAKYQFTPQLNIELLYTNFWYGTNTGLGETFNIGIKYLTK